MPSNLKCELDLIWDGKTCVIREYALLKFMNRTSGGELRSRLTLVGQFSSVEH